MKKIICIAAAVAMAFSCAVTALADTTTVKMSVDPAYTVIIPEAVSLSETTSAGGTVSYVGSGTVAASKGLRLEEGKRVEVTLTDCDYKLSSNSGSYTLGYTISVDGKSITSANNLVATFTSENGDTVQTSEMSFTAADPDYAGTYSDTVTFTVAVVNG